MLLFLLAERFLKPMQVLMDPADACDGQTYADGVLRWRHA